MRKREEKKHIRKAKEIEEVNVNEKAKARAMKKNNPLISVSQEVFVKQLFDIVSNCHYILCVMLNFTFSRECAGVYVCMYVMYDYRNVRLQLICSCIVVHQRKRGKQVSQNSCKK